MPQPTSREESIFAAALERPTDQDRQAYLAEACAGEPGLIARVRDLLRAHEGTKGPLDAPPPGVVSTRVHSRLSEAPGSQIGAYKLLQRIGEGGFGTVYMAEQLEPVRRKLALKIVKPGMDSKEVIARFEAERQALALMDHPNVATCPRCG